jgi:hypothetical protein
MMQHVELLAEFRVAFPEHGMPLGPVTGHRCGECDEVDDLLRGRTWYEVAMDLPRICHSAYPLLTSEAMHYYTPAYMLTALGPEAGIQSISIESAVRDGRLNPAEFTTAQRMAIVHWALLNWAENEKTDPPDWFMQAWLDPSVGIDSTHPA